MASGRGDGQRRMSVLTVTPCPTSLLVTDQCYVLPQLKAEMLRRKQERKMRQIRRMMTEAEFGPWG